MTNEELEAKARKNGSRINTLKAKIEWLEKEVKRIDMCKHVTSVQLCDVADDVKILSLIFAVFEACDDGEQVPNELKRNDNMKYKHQVIAEVRNWIKSNFT